MSACGPACPSIRRAMMCILYLSGFCSCLHNYEFIDEPKTWSEARDYCRKKYTDLATTENMEDMERLIAAAGSGYEGKVWIGLQDKYWEWRWSLSDPYYYQNGERDFRKWYKGEPNDSRAHAWICVAFMNGLWYDLPCSGHHTFVCYNGKMTGLVSTSIDRYFYINQTKTWGEALNYCRQHHTDLASVRNDHENNIIQQRVPHDQMVLIGLHSRPWSWWSDRTHHTFRNWADGHPSNRTSSCAASVFNATHPGKWMEYNCNNKFDFMCYNNKKQVFNFKLTALKSTIDLNDPAVTEAILNLVRKKIKEKGITENLKISWIKKHGKSIFHREERNADVV